MRADSELLMQPMLLVVHRFGDSDKAKHPLASLPTSDLSATTAQFPKQHVASPQADRGL